MCYDTCYASVCSNHNSFPTQVTRDLLDYKVPKELQEFLESAPLERWAPQEDRDHQGP